MANKQSVHSPTLEIRWKMFHGFKDTGWLQIRPLTILIGANGTGKSSLVAPLLLLKQTLESPESAPSLVSKGKIIDVGKFVDVAYKHDRTARLSFAVRFHTHETNRKIRKLGAYPPGAIELQFIAGKSSREFVLESYQVYDMYKRLFLNRSLLASGNYNISDEHFRKLRTNERKLLLKSTPVNFMFSPSKVISEISSLKKPPHSSPNVNYSNALQFYLGVVGVAYDAMSSLLYELSYIGPIRERPKRYYERTGELPLTVGGAGESAPQMFREKYSSLRKKVDYWAKAFGLASTIRCEDVSDDLFEVQLASSKPSLVTNISDSGFGASQLFPLIVQAITADEGSLTIAEQPEIHLNPRCQSTLADLFVEMATNGRRAIVETHSEHLLLRLRRLVAEGTIKPSEIALYFVEKIEGETKVREVPISDDGHIESSDWPAGFFEDALRESLALAAAQN